HTGAAAGRPRRPSRRRPGRAGSRRGRGAAPGYGSGSADGGRGGGPLTVVASPAAFASGQAVPFGPAPFAALQGVFSFTPSFLPGPNGVSESAVQTSFHGAVEAEASGLLSLANPWGASRQDGSSATGSRPAANSVKEKALDELFQGWELGGESW